MAVKKPEVVVVAHDAGAAELIAAYVRDHKGEAAFRVYAAGPAAKIFRREGLETRPIRDSKESINAMIERHHDAACALFGTGWMTAIESHALAAAKECGIPTAVYLDSWKDYRIAFGYPARGWKRNLPDELWAGDIHAQALARKQFPKAHIELVPNGYFAATIARFKRMSKDKKNSASRILFTSIPRPIALDVFSDLLAVLAREKAPPEVIIRLHPADPAGRYDDLIKRYRGRVRVTYSKNADIVRDLASVRAVVGTETVALVVSVLCGIKTIRIVKGKPKMILPFSEIKVVRTAKGAIRLL